MTDIGFMVPVQVPLYRRTILICTKNTSTCTILKKFRPMYSTDHHETGTQKSTSDRELILGQVLVHVPVLVLQEDVCFSSFFLMFLQESISSVYAKVKFFSSNREISKRVFGIYTGF
jgi:hypothetical protein